MFSKLILCASPNRLVAGYWRFGQCVACQAFGANEEGREAFRYYLRRHLQQYSRVPIFLIANAAEEDYRVDTVPHATGVERKAILARKLGQVYRNTQYRAAHFVGREQHQRKDDRFLFMALNNADIISPWVAMLEQQQAHLAGIYLQPLVSELMLARLKIKSPATLLISRQDIGLRQSYFLDGKLRTSRLTRVFGMRDANDKQLAELILSEAQKTRTYLASQRLVEHATPLMLIVLGVRDGVWRQLDFTTQPGFESAMLSPGEAAKQWSVQTSLLEEFPELLHMQALAHRVPEANLASAAQTRTYFLQKWRNAINIASTVVLLGSISLSSIFWIEARDNNSQRVLVAEQIATQIANYRQVAKNFPQTSFSADELRSIVEATNKLAESARTPQRLMQIVSAALDETPELQLNMLRWTMANSLDVSDGEEPGAQETTAAPSIPQASQVGKGSYEIGFIVGEARGFHQDFHDDAGAVMERVTRLIELLRKNAAVAQVTIVNQPTSAGLSVPLQGSTRGGQLQQASAVFKLKIVLKPGTRL